MAYPYQTQGFTLDNSGRRIVVDPVTRIEGHMRCEVNIDSNNVITNAVSTGTMWRGLEVILKGRDPRDAWAFVERICGVCTGTHALTSIRAVENALGIAIPDNANCIRNMMQATLHVHDHLVHFYHLHALDWVDVVAALKADPHQTSAIAQSLSAWPLSSPGYFRDLQNRLKRFIESGQLGPFRNGYWGHPAMKLPPEANLLAVAHYLEALDFQKEIVKIHTVFGGKNPHPNWLVGGVPCAINLDETGAVGAVNMERLNLVSSIIQKARWRVNYFNDMNTLLQDMIEIADIPDIAVAGIDDIEDAYAGLKNTLEWLKEYPVTENEPVVRMECKVCWWVYDPTLGDDVWQIPPGVPFSQLPDYWCCPVCETSKSGFMVIDEGNSSCKD
ncbi:hypothetical protein FD97_08060 [Salmonella enterica subsp. enterica serovar Muenchen]|nr:hypothetical protein [Salmonella enterica subsp. enterica serovar Muenchen]